MGCLAREGDSAEEVLEDNIGSNLAISSMTFYAGVIDPAGGSMKACLSFIGRKLTGLLLRRLHPPTMKMKICKRKHLQSANCLEQNDFSCWRNQSCCKLAFPTEELIGDFCWISRTVSPTECWKTSAGKVVLAYGILGMTSAISLLKLMILLKAYLFWALWLFSCLSYGSCWKLTSPVENWQQAPRRGNPAYSTKICCQFFSRKGKLTAGSISSAGEVILHNTIYRLQSLQK